MRGRAGDLVSRGRRQDALLARRVHRQRSSHLRRWHAADCVAAALLLIGAASADATQIITTTYSYDADGALTAATTQRGGQAPTTTYLTYDNFLPDGSDPATGTVRAANGNLVAIGTSPGTADSAQFAYDQRDRLTTCSVSGEPGVAYAYHPNSLLAAATLASGDSQQFYYGASALMTNTRQPATGLASSFLGPMRYLTDGSIEQALLLPRKDTMAVYEPAAQNLAPYGYDPYGAPRMARSVTAGLSPDAQRWDLSYNPFQYTGAYEDPVCRAYYLQHRWYLPAQQSFLSRDPLDATHHYGYTGGNPIGRIDPSGLSYTYADYQGDVHAFLKHLSFAATVLSILPGTGEAMFLLQATAAGQFWHSWRESLGFGLGALAVGIEGGRDLSGPLLNVDRTIGYRRAFGGRIAADLAVGLGQTTLASFSGTHWRFEPKAFGINIALTFGTMGAGRFGAGFGYRPFSLTADDVDAQITEFLQTDRKRENLLVFRAQDKLQGWRPRWTTPWMEQAHVGVYHEAVIGVERLYNNTTFQAHTAELSFIFQDDSAVLVPKYASFMGDQLIADENDVRFQYVGTFPKARALTAMRQNPLGFPTDAEQVAEFNRTGAFKPNGYGELTKNCQGHAAKIVAQMQQ